MSVSVSFKNRKTLGQSLNVDMVLMYIKEAAKQLQNQANTQGVDLDWNRAVILFGQDGDEIKTFSGTLVYPELSIEVPSK